ncbi:MAG: M24 family metallopeptidase, partial [Planctomycetota bacterium]|nr:M24 family metallopeptidase [Planctomycetota bacterium]
LFELVAAALEKAEALISPGAAASAFSEVIIETFGAAGEELVHHAGHAIGLGHPEAPELVLETDRVIESGMVLTLEPGVYGKPSGGIRLEHDYLVTDDGFERLSNHELGLA